MSMHVDVLVKPRSKRTSGLVEQADGSFVLHTNEPPVDGRANAAAVVAIAQYFGVSRSNVRLVRGQKSRHKVFDVDVE